MIGIFLKELRENAKWAALIFGALLVIVYFQVRATRPDLLFELAQPPQIVYAALAGVLLGFMQSLFEMRADNWAFVVHRPLLRLKIFLAKCIAGLLLLYVSLELPFLLAGLWAAQPGHLPGPFQARMILPTLAIALNGGVYYFTAMVITLRQARWFGSRVLPLGLAIGCSVAIAYATEFWQAMLFVLAGHAIAGMAAWNAFSTAGAADRRGAPRFALGTMIYAGVLGMGCGLVAFLGVFQTIARWQAYRMDRDGNMLRVTWTLQHGERNCVITDANGNALPEYEGVDPSDTAYADRFMRLTGLLDNRDLPWPASTLMHGGYGSSMPGVSRLSSVAKAGVRMRSLCYYNMQRRIIEMYDPMTRVMIGAVGPAGFSPPHVAPAPQFPPEPNLRGSGGGGHTLAFPSAVYWMELDQRRVRPVFTATDDDPVTCANELPPQTDPSIIIATRARLHLVSLSGKPLLSIPLKYDLTRRYIEVALLPSNHHLIVWAGQILPADDEPPSEITEYATNGKLVDHKFLPPLEQGGQAKLPRTASFGFVFPLGALPLYRSWLMDAVFDLSSQRHSRLFHGCLFTASLLSAVGTLLLARRYGFGAGKSVRWSVGNLLLGPAGIAVLVSLHELPAGQTCEACGGRRLAGRIDCPRCGAALPPPRLDGREIFEPVDAFSRDDALQTV